MPRLLLVKYSYESSRPFDNITSSHLSGHPIFSNMLNQFILVISRAACFGILLIATIGHAESSTADTLPSVEMYASNLMMVQLCSEDKAANLKLDSQKRQTLDYFKRKLAEANAADATYYAASIRQVEQGEIPATIRERHNRRWAKDPARAKALCRNHAMLIANIIALGEISMAEESKNPAAMAAANKRARETLITNGEGMRKGYETSPKN